MRQPTLANAALWIAVVAPAGQWLVKYEKREWNVSGTIFFQYFAVFGQWTTNEQPESAQKTAEKYSKNHFGSLKIIIHLKDQKYGIIINV